MSLIEKMCFCRRNIHFNILENDIIEMQMTLAPSPTFNKKKTKILLIDF